MSLTLPLKALAVLGLLLTSNPCMAAAPAETSSPEAPSPVIGDPLAQCQKLLTNITADDADCRQLAATPGDPNAARAQSLLGERALRRGELDIAREHIEAAVVMAPADGAVQNNYANLLLRQGRYADALAAYEIALDDATLSRSDIAALHLNRSLCLRALGRYDAAKNAFEAHRSWLAPEPLEDYEF